MLNILKARKNFNGSRIFIKENFPNEIQERSDNSERPIMKRVKAAKKEAFFNVDTPIFYVKPYTVNNRKVDIFKMLSIASLNSRKACGYDGQTPHVLKLGATILMDLDQ